MTMAAYEYVFPGLYKAPAQKVGELLEKLEKSGAGLSPETLLAASRPKKALLHGEFEWDDGVAAEKWRLRQAQAIIQSVRVVIQTTDREERERGFVSAPGRQSAYVALETAMGRGEYEAHLFGQAWRDMESFMAKYRRLEKLAPVIRAIDGIMRDA